MPNHFDQAELIIQTESGDFAFVIEPAPTSIIGTMTDPKPFYNAESSRWAHAQAWNNIYCWAHFLEKATRHPQDP